MPYHPELKVVGWTSSYKSVGRLLKWLRRKKLEDDVNQTYLDSIHLFSQALDKTPDEIVAMGKKHALDLTDTFVEDMKRRGVDERELNIRLAQVITFLSVNRAW